MEMKSELNQVGLASVENQDLERIKELEKELDDKYYLIAYKRDETE